MSINTARKRIVHSLSEIERIGLKAFLNCSNTVVHITEIAPYITSYAVVINYDRTVEQLAKADDFDRKDDLITSDHFPSSERGQTEVIVYLIDFSRLIDSEGVIKELDKLDLRPATLKEVMSLLAQYTLKRFSWILALGSTWDGPKGFVYIPQVGTPMDGNVLQLRTWPSLWGELEMFAAVHK